MFFSPFLHAYHLLFVFIFVSYHSLFFYYYFWFHSFRLYLNYYFLTIWLIFKRIYPQLKIFFARWVKFFFLNLFGFFFFFFSFFSWKIDEIQNTLDENFSQGTVWSIAILDREAELNEQVSTSFILSYCILILFLFSCLLL